MEQFESSSSTVKLTYKQAFLILLEPERRLKVWSPEPWRRLCSLSLSLFRLWIGSSKLDRFKASAGEHSNKPLQHRYKPQSGRFALKVHKVHFSLILGLAQHCFKRNESRLLQVLCGSVQQASMAQEVIMDRTFQRVIQNREVILSVRRDS